MPVPALGPARLPPVQPVAEAGLALPDRRVGGPPTPLPPLGQVEPPCPVRCTPSPAPFSFFGGAGRLEGTVDSLQVFK